MEVYLPKVIEDACRYSNFRVHTSHFSQFPLTFCKRISRARSSVLVRPERYFARPSSQPLWESTTVSAAVLYNWILPRWLSIAQLLLLCRSQLHTHTWQLCEPKALLGDETWTTVSLGAVIADMELATRFTLFSSLAYSCTLKIQAECSSEMSLIIH